MLRVSSVVLLLLVQSGLAQVYEDQPTYDDVVDLAEERPDLTDLFLVTPQDDAGLFGSWSVPARWPIVAIHAALLPDGDVLTYGTNEFAEPGAGFVYDRWRPSRGLASASHYVLDVETSNNLFCSAQALIPGTGGLMLVTGGSVERGGRRNYGIRAANVFDPINNTFYKPVDPMKKARWYPTVTQLADGRVFVQGGRDELRKPTVIPEVFDPDTGKWKLLTSAESKTLYNEGWNYPRAFAAPNGDVLTIPPHQKDIYYVDPDGRGKVRRVRELSGVPTPGELLAVMYDANRILSVRGRDARKLTLTESDKVYSDNIADMATERHWADATLLANGEVMVSGGATVRQSLDNAVNYVEIWNPDTETWRIGASAAKARLYHSTSLLLPTGVVLCAGGGPPGPVSNLNAEIYYPPYLFDNEDEWRERPRILGLASEGGSRIEIRAKGRTGLEKFKLRIDDKHVRTFSVTDNIASYIHETDRPVTGDQVEIFYHNHDETLGTDIQSGNLIPGRLTVDYIRIDGDIHQTENKRVVSKIEGNFDQRRTQHLPSNGLFQYWEKPQDYLQLGSLPYGQDLNLLIDRANSVSKVMMIRFGSVTHSFDMGQRGLSLGFEQEGDFLSVNLPAKRKQCPPGFYMLFVLDETGTPSIAALLELE